MDEKSLQKNIDSLKRELLALKTARDRGIGGMAFYSATTELALIDYMFWEVVVRVVADSVLPFFCQVSVSDPLATFFADSTTISPSGDTMTFRYFGMYESYTPITIRVVSTAEVASITARNIPWSEID